MATDEDFEPEPEFPEPREMCFFTQDELAEMWRESRDFVEDETKWP